MSLLLDTHVFFWWITDDARLPEVHRARIAAGAQPIFVSAVTGWEIATKVKTGKWPEAAVLLPDLAAKILGEGFQCLDVTVAQAEYAGKKEQTRRDLFLAQMQTGVPWARLIAVIEPHYPTSRKRGRQPRGIERLRRMYFVQQWYGLADVAVEDALYDRQALRTFCGGECQ